MATLTQEGVYLYVTVAVSLGVLVIWLVSLAVSKAERTRRDQLADQLRTQALHALPSDAVPKLRAEVQAIEAIARRFNTIRRVVIPLLIVVWGLAASVPLLASAPAAVVSLVVGVGSVVVGIAVKPLVDQFFAGLAITFGQVARVGDTVVIDGNWGTIEEVTATSTVVKLWDWRRYVIPNVSFLEKAFFNYTLFDRYHWAHVAFWVEPAADLLKVQQVAVEAVKAAKGFVPYEEPAFWVMQMDKDGLLCWVAGWADDPNDGWTMTHEVRTKLAHALRDSGIRFQGATTDVRFPGQPHLPFGGPPRATTSGGPPTG